MNTYTTIGYFEHSPHEPLCFVVKATDVRDAITQAERDAETLKTEKTGVFINTFVIEGKPKILSTWAG